MKAYNSAVAVSIGRLSLCVEVIRIFAKKRRVVKVDHSQWKHANTTPIHMFSKSYTTLLCVMFMKYSANIGNILLSSEYSSVRFIAVLVIVTVSLQFCCQQHLVVWYHPSCRLERISSF